MVKLPRKSARLAELLGIIAGDGGISLNWQVKIYLNAVLDLEYSVYVQRLFHNLFGINTSSWIRNGGQPLVLTCNSATVVDFLVDHGAVKGHKFNNYIRIPEWVLFNVEYRKAFIRGLFDTDGCSFVDKHIYNNKTYKYLGVTITNYAARLLAETKNCLNDLGLHPTITTKNNLFIRRQNEVLNFIELIKPKNKRHINVIKRYLEEYRSGCNGTVSKAVVV